MVDQEASSPGDQYCPKCNREFTGAIETASAVLAGITLVVMQETPDRNWIICDGCAQTICKQCCVMPDSGYCDSCFYEYKIRPFIP